MTKKQLVAFGRAIAAYRVKENLSLEGLADSADVCRQTVRRLERGTVKFIHESTRIRLETTCGIKAEE